MINFVLCKRQKILLWCEFKTWENNTERTVPRLGVWEPIGHADYYPNGGRAQSGCQNLLIGGLYDFIYCEFSVEDSSRAQF